MTYSRPKVKRWLRMIGYACFGVGAIPFTVRVLFGIECLTEFDSVGGGLLMILGAILRYAGEPRTVDPPPA
jgi:hypothetical protein